MADEVEVTGQTPDTREAVQEPKQVTLTEDMVRKIVQSETDRVRTEYSRKLKETEAEKEVLIKERMSDKERTAYELERREKELDEKNKTIADRELKLLKADVIGEMEIPKALADYVTGGDRDTMIANATQLMDTFRTEVAREVNRKLAGSSARPESSDPDSSPSRGQLDDLGDWKKIFAMRPGPEKDKAITDRMDAVKRMGVE